MKIFFAIVFAAFTGVIIAFNILLFFETIFKEWMQKKREAFKRKMLIKNFSVARSLFSTQQIKEIYTEEELKELDRDTFYG